MLLTRKSHRLTVVDMLIIHRRNKIDIYLTACTNTFSVTLHGTLHHIGELGLELNMTCVCMCLGCGLGSTSISAVVGIGVRLRCLL